MLARKSVAKTRKRAQRNEAATQEETGSKRRDAKQRGETERRQNHGGQNHRAKSFLPWFTLICLDRRWSSMGCSGGIRRKIKIKSRRNGTLSPLWTREPVRNQCLRAFFEALPVRSPVRNRAVGAKSVQSLKSKVQSPESKVRGVKGSCLKPAAAFRGSLLICAIRLVSLTSDKSRQGVRGSILLPYVGQEVQSLGPAFAVLQLSLRHYQVESAGLSKSQRTQRTQRTRKCRKGLRDYGTTRLRDHETTGPRDYGTTRLRGCGKGGGYLRLRWKGRPAWGGL